jgi:hypothetical protein
MWKMSGWCLGQCGCENFLSPPTSFWSAFNNIHRAFNVRIRAITWYAVNWFSKPRVVSQKRFQVTLSFLVAIYGQVTNSWSRAGHRLTIQKPTQGRAREVRSNYRVFWLQYGSLLMSRAGPEDNDGVTKKSPDLKKKYRLKLGLVELRDPPTRWAKCRGPSRSFEYILAEMKDSQTRNFTQLFERHHPYF